MKKSLIAPCPECGARDILAIVQDWDEGIIKRTCLVCDHTWIGTLYDDTK